MRCRVKNVPTPQDNFFFVSPVWVVRPSPVTDNLRGGQYTISGNKMIYLPCGIGALLTLNLIMINFHYINEKKLIKVIFIYTNS